MPASSSVGLRPASHSSSSSRSGAQAKRTRQLDALVVEVGKRVGMRAERAVEAHARKQALGLGARGRDVEPAAAVHGGDRDVVARVERIGDARELEGAGDAGAANRLRACGR